LGTHVRIERSAYLYDFDARRPVHVTQRPNRAERILLAPQVPDDGDAEAGLDGCVAQPRLGRLMDNTGLAPKRRCQLAQAFLLEHGKPRRHRQRAPRVCVLPDVPVEIGSGQRHDQGRIGSRQPETPYRGVTLAGVQGQQEIVVAFRPLGLDSHPVPEVAQEIAPARGRVPVAAAGRG